MENFKRNSVFIVSCLLLVCFLSCSKSNTELELKPEPVIKSTYDIEMEDELKGTTWKRWKEDYGNYIESVNGPTVTFDNDGIVYLFDSPIGAKDWYGTWEVENKELWITPEYDSNSDIARKWMIVMGLGTEVIRISESELVISHNSHNDYYKRLSFRRGHSGGGTTSGEAPNVTSFDYTATSNSLTVKFYTDEKPTSASVYYGENSATKSAGTPTIASKQVSVTVRGLKSGTKYYFKCIVRNEYGSSTSDGWPAMTYY